MVIRPTLLRCQSARSFKSEAQVGSTDFPHALHLTEFTTAQPPLLS